MNRKILLLAAALSMASATYSNEVRIASREEGALQTEVLIANGKEGEITDLAVALKADCPTKGGKPHQEVTEGAHQVTKVTTKKQLREIRKSVMSLKELTKYPPLKVKTVTLLKELTRKALKV